MSATTCDPGRQQSPANKLDGEIVGVVSALYWYGSLQTALKESFSQLCLNA